MLVGSYRLRGAVEETVGDESSEKAGRRDESLMGGGRRRKKTNLFLRKAS